MINVTDQVNEHPNRKDMPTVGEFVSAKLTDAFSTLGENFGKGKDRLAIKKDIFEALKTSSNRFSFSSAA